MSKDIIYIKRCKYVEFPKGTPCIKIQFPFDMRTVDKIKELNGRRFHKTKNGAYWSAPLSMENINKLDILNFSFDEKLTDWYGQKTLKKMKNLKPNPIFVPGLDNILYPYQKIGVGFIENTEGRCILGDDMGLGKTIQALSYIKLHQEFKNIIVVCPASVKLQWVQKTYLRLEKDINVFQLNSFPTKNPNFADFYETNEFLNSYEPNKQNIYIVNYKIFTNKFEKYRDNNNKEKKKELKYTGWCDYLNDLNPDLIIVDEVHRISNQSTNVSKSMKRIGKTIPKFIGLSGTPVESKPIDIFTAADIIDNTLFGSWWRFAHRYCDPKHNGYGWDFSGNSNMEELHSKLKPIMIRRLKRDVMADLPDKRRVIIPLKIKNKSNYEKILYSKEIKNKIEALKQVALQGKMDDVFDWVDDFLKTGEKLILYVWHNSTIEKLMTRYKKIAVEIHGSTSMKDREINKNKFIKSCETKLIIGNILSLGTGVDGLQNVCSTCAFVELPWKPSEVDQAEDRLLRIGQKSNKMTSYFFIAENTIEDDIIELLDRKRKVVNKILNGEETEDFDLLTELKKKYK